ncbi:hypothetical protein DNTS_018279 [Danionella cerebrum]|uniref:Class E basic helix-loop-helix protein 22 n=1 Tax=Danionella cerebrum TaxID=2873325 RepID=A0A553RK68_9TELE|nr:hypothetical protein DNTS_018279 [Danionella translucida]
MNFRRADPMTCTEQDHVTLMGFFNKLGDGIPERPTDVIFEIENTSSETHDGRFRCMESGYRELSARDTDNNSRALRLLINSRERRRMRDLNDALDELRAVLPYTPYASKRNVKKLSKIATLLLAKNHIMMQARALKEMRSLVEQMNATQTAIKKQPLPY